MKALASCLALAAGLCAAPAGAEAQQLRIMPRAFEAMDENKDGVVTRAEYEGTFNR